MRRIFSSILSVIWSLQKKHLLIIAGLVLSGSCFALEDSEVLTNIVVVLNLILSLILIVITPAVILAWWLLSPDWTMGDFFGLREYFLQVWVLVSNLVYIIFALLLLYMAIMQIFSGESEFAFKQKLPQFLVGILIVPFTWLIVSWTLSFANQAVAAVLSIPMGAIGSLNTNDPKTSMFHKRVIPTVLSFNLAEWQWKEAQGCKGGQTTTSDGDTVNCISAAEFVTNNGSGPFFIILIYAYDIFQINTADLVEISKLCTTSSDKASSRDCIKDMMGIIRTAGLGLIVTTFFGILIIALCWVLLARALKLWIYVMFSPLFWLAYFTGNGWGEAFHSEWGGGGGDTGMTKLGFVPFFKLAMVPVLVSAVLSFGLLFVGVMRSSFTGAQDGDSSGISVWQTVCSKDDFLVRYCITKKSDNKEEWYESSLVIGSNTADGGAPGEFAIQFKFGTSFSPLIDDAVSGKSAIGALGGAVDSVEDIFAHLIITMIALAIIWTGVKAAVEYDEVTKIAFKPFAQLGDSTVKMIQQIPSMIPLPHPALAALTPWGAKAISQGINTGLATAEANRAKDLMSVLQNPGQAEAARALESGAAKFSEVSEKLGEDLLTNDRVRRATVADLGRVIKNVKDETTRGDLEAQLRNAKDDPVKIKAVADKLESFKADQFITPLDDNDRSLLKKVKSSWGWSSEGSASNVSVTAEGNVSGLKWTNGSIKISQITRDNLSPGQISTINNRRDKLKNLSGELESARIQFLDEELGIKVPNGQSANDVAAKLLEVVPEGS